VEAVRRRDPQAAREAAHRHVELGRLALETVFAQNK
jgi:DNA-binding GntR family transcriptional regulator